MGTFVTSSDALPTARTNRPGTGAATQTYHWDATHANYAWNAASDLRNHAPGWLSAKSTAYGATGDGTTNDTTALQALVAAAVAAGKAKIFLPAGTYLYGGASGTLDFAAGTKITIQGDGMGRTVLKFAVSGSTGRAISIGATGADQANTRIKFQDLSIEGTSSAAGGVDIIRRQGVSFQNVEIYGFSTSGAAAVRIRGSNSCRFWDCEFRTSGVGVEFTSQTSEPNLNTFHGCQITGNTRAVKHDLGEGNAFYDCNIASTTSSPAMLFTRAVSPTLMGNYFEGNLEGASTYDIQLGAGASDFSNGAVLIGNKFFGQPTAHIQVKGGGGNSIYTSHVAASPTQAHVRTETDASQTGIWLPNNPGGAATILSEGSSSLDTWHFGPAGNMRSGAGGLFKLTAGFQNVTAGTPVEVRTVDAADVTILRLNNHSGTLCGSLTRNLRGTVTISDAATSAAVSFGVNEPDTSYFVTLSVHGTAGSPTIGFPYYSSKAVSGFTVNLSAAPGAGTSVAVEYHVIR